MGFHVLRAALFVVFAYLVLIYKLPNNWENDVDTTKECIAGAGMGIKAGCRGYQIRFDTSKSCKVNILLRVAGMEKFAPLIRFDSAHGNKPPPSNVPHVNLNAAINKKVKADPHWSIPRGEKGLQV